MRNDRLNFTLTKSEENDFYRIKPLPGEAYDFWKKVADERDLDYRTIISSNYGTFSGLKRGHNTYWCYPFLLKCKFNPKNYKDAE